MLTNWLKLRKETAMNASIRWRRLAVGIIALCVVGGAIAQDAGPASQQVAIEAVEPEITALSPAWSPKTVAVSPASLDIQWKSRPMAVSPARSGAAWGAQTLDYKRMSIPGSWEPASLQQEPSSVNMNAVSMAGRLASELPQLLRQPPQLAALLAAARDSRWEAVAAEMERFGIDRKCVVEAAAAREKVKPSFDLPFGGELDPAWSAEKLADRVKLMKSLGFAVPIVPIRQISGDWRKGYDAFFAAVDGKVTPVVGLCVGQMDTPDLLAVPEFLRRYEGKYHSVIVNYDLTNGQIDGMQGPPAFRQAADRVSLALALTERATPAAYCWLAVGYNRAPGWSAWVSAFDRKQFAGLMLSGHSAVSACMNPQVAGQIRRQINKEFPDAQIGLINFRLHTLDWLLFSRDDQGIQRYTTIRASLRQAGITPVHIAYTAGH